MRSSFLEILTVFLVEVVVMVPRTLGAGFIWLVNRGKWSYDYYYEENAVESIVTGFAFILGLILAIVLV